MNVYLNCTLALLALINPLSKIFILSTLSQNDSSKSIKRIAIKASVVAVSILIIFTFAGKFILTNIFRVDIYSFQIIGGLILIIRGYKALSRGLFFETEINQRLEDASIVPLASPMIAGPATLTAAISFPSSYGFEATIIAIILSILVNFILMLHTQSISKFLMRFNLMGALIRIVGLIVSTIGVQMMLNGFSEYLKTI